MAKSQPHVEKLTQLKVEVRRREKEIAQQFPTFTHHNMDHFDAVANAAHVLSKKIDLSDEEGFCLTAACYCHDLGMAHTNAQHDYALWNREQLRKWHAKLSAQYVHTLPHDLFPTEGLQDAVARISEAHGRWDWEDVYFDDAGGIRIRLLSALLSLSDALDLRNGRKNPEHLRNAEELMEHAFLGDTPAQNPAIAKNPELRHASRVHWLRHYYAFQPGLTMDKAGRTATIQLKARIGLREKQIDKPVFDEREPLIKEMIQSELVELTEWPKFKRALEGHLTVKLQAAEGAWPSYVECQPDTNKMLFPEQLIEAVYATGLVRPRSLPVDAGGYERTRIEGLIGPSDIQVSISWLPRFLMHAGDRDAVDDRLMRLAERNWDFVLWPIGPAVAVLRDEAMTGHGEIIEKRFRRVLERLTLIRSGQYKKYYIALDQPLPPQPMAATRHVAKFGLYAGLGQGAPLRGGFIELGSLAQQSGFETACEVAAQLLGVQGPRETLPARLLEIANPEAAFVTTSRSLRSLLTALERGIRDVPIAAHLRAFLDEFAATLQAAEPGA
jgi:hypothetical protein